MVLTKQNYHQRGESIMAQGVLAFKYETEKKTTGMTALGGLPAYLGLAQVIGLSKSIQKHLKLRAGGQGWTDTQMVLALVLLNLAGGDCVEDIKVIEADEGDSVFIDQLTRSRRKTFTASYHSANKKSSVVTVIG
jgi:hypothetical protein